MDDYVSSLESLIDQLGTGKVSLVVQGYFAPVVVKYASTHQEKINDLILLNPPILGPGSGWQPISLTDIIMSNAVKKAYRKATLHVHPDKPQQRGASIREKYICEKVFDLLKAAWNRFSSKER